MTPVVHDRLDEKPARGDTASTPTFEPYQTLGEDEIRLVEIMPANSQQENVVCRLRRCSRDHAPSYRALSYSWGPPEERNRGSILLDAGDVELRAIKRKRIELPVTPTLEAALRRLRYNDGRTPQLIWIDAICINQNDDKEKGKQVQSMRIIYQNAAEVSIWLGVDDEKSLLAWELIQGFEDCHGDIKAIERLIEPSREKQFAALLALFRRDYFWRIWVVQEITCAKKAVVYCGSKMMPWPNFQNIGNVMEKVREKLRDSIFHDKPAALFSLMTGGPKNLKVARPNPDEEFKQTTAPPLLDLLMLHTSKLSTNPHDKVYGLMGIASDGSSFGPIDYERSPRATFIHVARRIISNTKKLNMICLSQNDDNLYLLPSWVPDWERRKLYPSHRVVGLHIRQPPFKASGDTHANAKFLEDGEVLLTDGYVVDTITTAARPFYLDGPESEVTPTLMAFHNWFTVFVSNAGTDTLEVFARTFCGGAWYPRYSEFEKDLSRRLTFFFGLIQKLLPGLLQDGNPVQHLVEDNQLTREVLEAREYAMVSAAALRMHAKRFILTRTKLAGLAPQEAKEGDKIVVLLGCDFPVVLRRIGNYWKLIGEVYVDGIMHKETVHPNNSFAIR
jgi:hypothetical protein